MPDLPINERMEVTVKRYGMALGSVGAAALVRWILAPVLLDGAPFGAFNIAVIFTAWYGGIGPALLATVLGFFTGLYLFISPHGPAIGPTVPELARYGMYFLVCITTAAFGESARRSQKRSLQAELIAKHQAEILRITFASIKDAVITSDCLDNVTYLNSAAENLTGWTNQTAKGQSLATIFNVIVEYTPKPLEARALMKGEPKPMAGRPIDSILVNKDGSKRVVDSSVSVFKDATGDDIGKIIIFRDISQKRLLEAGREAS